MADDNDDVGLGFDGSADEEEEEDSAEEASDDEQRHLSMLVAVRGSRGDRRNTTAKAGRQAKARLVSEAYPESAYNLGPAGAFSTRLRVRHWAWLEQLNRSVVRRHAPC